jgi:hypothetical protein
MDKLPSKMRSLIYSKALLAGGAVVRDKASINVKSVVSSEASGVLAKNLRVYRLKKKRGWYRAGVMVRRGAVNKRKRDGNGKPVRVGLYGSVLEYGKKNQPPRAWLRPAYASERGKAESRVRQVFTNNLLSALESAKKS